MYSYRDHQCQQRPPINHKNLGQGFYRQNHRGVLIIKQSDPKGTMDRDETIFFVSQDHHLSQRQAHACSELHNMFNINILRTYIIILNLCNYNDCQTLPLIFLRPAQCINHKYVCQAFTVCYAYPAIPTSGGSVWSSATASLITAYPSNIQQATVPIIHNLSMNPIPPCIKSHHKVVSDC